MSTPQQRQQQIIPVRPTVFVGLGGTGKDILLRLRMKFFERYGRFRYPCMSYLWIDTDMQNVNVDRKEMDPILRRALFNQSEQVDVQVMDPGDFLNNPSNYPWITRWMPAAVTQSGLRIQDGAGQVRAKGRFAFYWQFQQVQRKLLDAVTEVRNPQARAETARFSNEQGLNLYFGDEEWGPRVNFFLVCSLAGGTGSGTFLDAAFLIRKLATEQNFRPDITGLLCLSSLFANDPKDRRFANSYAALKELEYYNYTPVAGSRDIETDESDAIAMHKFTEQWAPGYPEAPVNGPPFNTCYLIDGYTYGGTPVTPDHKYEVFDMASEYLFWEFNRGDFASQKRTIRPNNRQYLDRNEHIKHGAQEKPFHTQRFSTGYSSFGLSWISVPIGSRIAACAFRLSQEVLEYWERGRVLSREEAQEALRQRNVVDEVRKTIHGDETGLTGQRLVEALATTRERTKFSELLKGGIDQFFQLQAAAQDVVEFVETFEDRYLARRTGAVINDNVEPSRTRVLEEYKDRLRRWIVRSLEAEGFIPLLGFTFTKPDSTQGRVRGYLDVLAEVVLPEVRQEVEEIRESFADKKAGAEEEKAIFLNNFEELQSTSLVLFREMSRRTILRRSLEAEHGYAEGNVGEWVCEVALTVIEDLAQYIVGVKAQLRAFQEGILSPTIGEFADMRQRHEKVEQRTLSINLYRDLGAYYRLGGDPVDVREEKEQLFQTQLPDLWKVVTQLTRDQFHDTVEKYGWKKFQDEFRRRLAAGSESESLGHAVQLFNEMYPPSDPSQRHSQITIFLGGGKPYVQPRMTLGPRAPQPRQDLFLGVAGINPSANPGQSFFDELRREYSLSQAQGIETEKEAVLYYHELTGFPLFYLSSLEQYRQSYDQFQSRIGELPVHLHRRVDLFPEIYLYRPEEAKAIFTAWEIVILGTLLRVLQVEAYGDDFRYFYYAGLAAEPRVIGDERGSVKTIFADWTKYDWCLKEIGQRKAQVYADPAQLKVYYGLLQMLRDKVYPTDSVRLAGGYIDSLPSFQSSVIESHIRDAEASSNGTQLPQRNPEGPSPEWEALVREAAAAAATVSIHRGANRTDQRFYIKDLSPYAVR
jgi:hypothetical protein